MTVNGRLIGAKTTLKSKLDTYFGAIAISYRPAAVAVTIGTDSIDVVRGGSNHSFTWATTTNITQDG